ncbi:MAG: hypothetical protein P4M00_16035 [Azospirillaceae bacterium]|nr:hypothetical protein [Azospirillaceae bacterium]
MAIRLAFKMALATALLALVACAAGLGARKPGVNTPNSASDAALDSAASPGDPAGSIVSVSPAATPAALDGVQMIAQCQDILQRSLVGGDLTELVPELTRNGGRSEISIKAAYLPYSNTNENRHVDYHCRFDNGVLSETRMQ